MGCGCNKKKSSVSTIVLTNKERAIIKTQTRTLPLVRTSGAKIRVKPQNTLKVKNK